MGLVSNSVLCRQINYSNIGCSPNIGTKTMDAFDFAATWINANMSQPLESNLLYAGSALSIVLASVVKVTAFILGASAILLIGLTLPLWIIPARIYNNYQAEESVPDSEEILITENNKNTKPKSENNFVKNESENTNASPRVKIEDGSDSELEKEKDFSNNELPELDLIFPETDVHVSKTENPDNESSLEIDPNTSTNRLQSDDNTKKSTAPLPQTIDLGNGTLSKTIPNELSNFDFFHEEDIDDGITTASTAPLTKRLANDLPKDLLSFPPAPTKSAANKTHATSRFPIVPKFISDPDGESDGETLELDLTNRDVTVSDTDVDLNNLNTNTSLSKEELTNILAFVAKQLRIHDRLQNPTKRLAASKNGLAPTGQSVPSPHLFISPDRPALNLVPDILAKGPARTHRPPLSNTILGVLPLNFANLNNRPFSLTLRSRTVVPMLAPPKSAPATPVIPARPIIASPTNDSALLSLYDRNVFKQIIDIAKGAKVISQPKIGIRPAASLPSSTPIHLLRVPPLLTKTSEPLGDNNANTTNSPATIATSDGLYRTVAYIKWLFQYRLENSTTQNT